MKALRSLTIGIALVALGMSRSAAAADTPLDEVKALYANAAYEAALKALEGLDPATTGTPNAEEYRILCLLALGRTADAQHAVEGLITKAPALVPAAEDFPPRFISMYTETRQRVLPTLVMDTFAAGREQFRASKRAEATAEFEKVMALSADPELAKLPDIADARTLAAGFLDLLKASTASAGAALRPAPTAAGGAGTAAAAAAAANAQAVTSVMTPAIPIRQTLPRWVAPDRVAASSQLTGAVRVVIGADGKVKSATIEASVHPSYDMLLLAAARDWRYTPAVLNGKPVESDRLIRVQITP